MLPRRTLRFRIVSGLLVAGFLLAAVPGHVHAVGGEDHGGDADAATAETLHDHQGEHGHAHAAAGGRGASSAPLSDASPAEGDGHAQPPDGHCAGCLCPTGPAGCAAGTVPPRAAAELDAELGTISRVGFPPDLSSTSRFDIFHPPRR